MSELLAFVVLFIVTVTYQVTGWKEVYYLPSNGNYTFRTIGKGVFQVTVDWKKTLCLDIRWIKVQSVFEESKMDGRLYALF